MPAQRMTALLVQLVSKHCNRRALSQNSRQSCSLRETEGEKEREESELKQKTKASRAPSAEEQGTAT